MKRYVVLLLAMLFVVGGCGDDDGGSSSGSYDTVREGAEAVFRAVCQQGIDCGDGQQSELEECVDTLVSLICDDEEVDCSVAPAGSDAQINSCIDAIGAQSCDAEELPDACAGIL